MAATKKAPAKKKAPAIKKTPGAQVQADEVAAKLEAFQNDPEPAPEMEPIRNVAAGVISQWGPFAQNTYVTTPHGDYGLPAAQVLTFTKAQKVDKDSMEIIDYFKPVRRKATKEEVRTSGVDLSHMQPSSAFFNAEEAASTAQIMEITINGEGSFPGVVKQAPVVERS